MSDFLEAYDYIMSSEDPWHEFRTVQDYGAQSISGINSAYWPKDFAAINALPIAQRGLAVENFYRDNYWNGKNFQLLSSQRLANYTMDADVNQGDGAKMLQMAADRLGATLIVDGIIGLLTLQAVNTMNPITLLDSFLVVRMDEYRDSIARNPEKAASLPGWTARAKKLGL